MRFGIIPALCLICLTANAQSAEDIIRRIMKDQEDCWNSGELECFMKSYWQSDSLMFVSSSQVYYGYDQTLNRYRNTYPDKAAMGQLTFEYITLKQLSESDFFVVGKYHLARKIGDLQGHFTLLWRKIEGNWVIVVDHSS